MFFRWYGLKVGEQPNLLFGLRLLDDGGSAWQTLETTPILLTLVIAVTVGAAHRSGLGATSIAGCSGPCSRRSRGVSNPDPDYLST